MAQHKDISYFSPELAPRSIRLTNLPLDAPHSEVESFLERAGFTRCVFYWDEHRAKEVLGAKNAGWCCVVFPFEGMAALAHTALKGKVFNGRTLLRTVEGTKSRRLASCVQHHKHHSSFSRQHVAAPPRQQQPEQGTYLPQQPYHFPGFGLWNLREKLLPPRAVARSLHLSGIPQDTPRIEVLTMLVNEGFYYCNLYWPGTDPRDLTLHDLGSCWVELNDIHLAEQARERLDGFQFRGRSLRATLLTNFSPLSPPIQLSQPVQYGQTSSAPDPVPPPTPRSPISDVLDDTYLPGSVKHSDWIPQDGEPAAIHGNSDVPVPAVTPESPPVALYNDDIMASSTTSTPQAQPVSRRNANKVAHKVLYASFRKLQETGDAANSCLMLQKILENLEIFGSDEGDVTGTFTDSTDTVLGQSFSRENDKMVPRGPLETS